MAKQLNNSAPYMAALTVLFFSAASSFVSAQSWSFVSAPDLFNSDVADLSGGTVSSINNAFPDPVAYSNAMADFAAPGFTNSGRNSLNQGMAQAYNQLFAEMQVNAGGNASTFLVAGDLINGRWPQNSSSLISNFGGTGTAAALDKAADIYYSWHRELARQHGFIDYLAALGDHDIGDNDWSLNSSRANHVDNMKRAFGRNMVDPLGLPATWNSVSSTAPQGLGEYDEGSFVKQVNNVLFVTVDVFRWEGSGVSQHPWYGSVTAEVTGTVGDANSHLGWLDSVLTAADNDASVDHVIVQGHTPVLSGVRKQASSGMMMQQRDDSSFWQVLQSHDQQNGGKVRMYFGGEVHTVTSTKDPESDIVQLVHGNPPLGSGNTNYLVFDVDGPNIEARMYRVDLQGGGGNYWQVSQNSTTGPSGITPGILEGTLSIDTSGPNTSYSSSGLLEFVRNRGVLLNYSFDSETNSGQFSNSGSLKDLYYAGTKNGEASNLDGKFGQALAMDGQGDFVRTAGGLAPISEGEQRTIAAWINTTEASTQAIFGYGQDNKANGEFNLQLANGKLQLNIDAGINATANNPAINDGQWHHVAVVLPGNHENNLGDVLFYVDGVEYGANSNSPDRSIRTFAGSNSRIHVGANAENNNSTQQFTGLIDEVSMWGAPLTAARVKSLVNAGNENELSLNTIEMESLFGLFDSQQGTVAVGGYTWDHAAELSGMAGDVIKLSDVNYGIVLDSFGNGVIGKASMVLSVDRNTGAVEIQNFGDLAISMDGYTIRSTGQSLDPSGVAWTSLFDQQTPGWIEANAESERLSEVLIAGSEVISPGAKLSLGTPFQPAPLAFGEPIEDLEFTYVNPEGEEVVGLIRYTGDNVNNLALIIDSATGDAELRNASDFDISLEGYTISSSASELNTAGWKSIQENGEPGWVEANPSTSRLSEVNLEGVTLVPAGEAFDLGNIFVGSDPNRGVTLRFWIGGDSSGNGREGHVLFQSLFPESLPGDFNNDGVVDAADYTIWREELGASEAVLNGNGDGSGVVDAADYNLWRTNFGGTSGQQTKATTAPEPGSLPILATAGAILYALHSRTSQHN